MAEIRTLTKQDIEQIFNGAAAIYDRIGPAIFDGFASILVKDIPVSRGMKVLDVATGTGAVLSRLAGLVGPEGHAIGTDFSTGILDEARKNIKPQSSSNIELVRMDAEHLIFPDESFDIVTCAFALFMFPDMKSALREMYRVGKPGGYAAVTYFGNEPPPFSPGWTVFARQSRDYDIACRMPQKLGITAEEMQALLQEAGFNGVQTHIEKYDIVYPTVDDWWGFLMTLGSRAVILSMDEETRARFKAEYLGKLQSARREDGFHMSTAVIYAVARR